jgi:alpha-ketoglutarate-dependent taurine dioxygenase
VRGEQTVRELLREVRETTLEAYEHQDVPFERIVEELQPDRNQSHTPIFQVLFVLQNARSQTPESGTAMIRVLPMNNLTSKYDWVVTVHETRNGISGIWQYNAELFDESTIERLNLEFRTILTKIAESPDTSLSKLELILMKENNLELSRGPSLLAGATPMTVALPLENPVGTSFFSDQTLPLIMSPRIDDFDLIEWAETEQEFIEKNLLEHGAILFRGFSVEGASEFERFASTICPELFGDYGDLPREGVGGRVYCSTPYPNDLPILLHNESSHMHRWPMKIWFYCLTAPQHGGETPVVDCRELYEQLDPALRQKLTDKGLLYVRNFGEGLDVSWQEFFRTSDEAIVEEFCGNAGIVCEWGARNRLRTKKVCAAVATHPKTGQLALFNQLQSHHVSCLDSTTREALLSQFGEDGLPRNVYYGDGERIPDSTVSELRQLYEKHAKSFKWKNGDILMVDNMTVAHGRNPFVGLRKILVAMGEMATAIRD